jgi:patatin-like phospholipase/acyl hydrolase
MALRVLSLDGGGYLGLATASFLQSIEDHFRVRCSDRFDLFCGTSTGAIIALAFAKGMSAKQVAELYEALGPKVFPPPNFVVRLVPKSRGVFAARHDNAPLRKVLDEAFGSMTLGDLRARGKMVLVTAFSLTSGRPKVFKTDHSPELTAHDKFLLRDVALASSAAPTYLPIVELVDPNNGSVERFCDGGLVANSPALLGYAEAVSSLRCNPSELSLLSLATPRTDLAEYASSRGRSQESLNRGYWRWGFGEQIINVSLDGVSMLSDTALARIADAAGAQYHRVRFSQPAGVEMDKVTKETTQTLRHLGSDRASVAEVRKQLRPYFLDVEVE